MRPGLKSVRLATTVVLVPLPKLKPLAVEVITALRVPPPSLPAVQVPPNLVPTSLLLANPLAHSAQPVTTAMVRTPPLG
jgi:hypothetical protein